MFDDTGGYMMGDGWKGSPKDWFVLFCGCVFLSQPQVAMSLLGNSVMFDHFFLLHLRLQSHIECRNDEQLDRIYWKDGLKLYQQGLQILIKNKNTPSRWTIEVTTSTRTMWRHPIAAAGVGQSFFSLFNETGNIKRANNVHRLHTISIHL
jgi:hypothetical protein